MSDFNNNIAIIGMACHYPGAPNLAAFWQNLVNGVESISRFSKEELLSAGVNPELVADPNYVPAYGWLDGIDEFDAPFFGLTPREAELLDPQQRLFLMCAWHALEDAAVNPQIEKRPVGVFAGAGQAIYYQENILTNRKLVAEMGAFQTTLSNDKDFLATRTSYKLNLKGPSLSVQTACSTSLVAIHLANQSLLNGECDLALAGGSSIVTTSKSGYLYSNEGLFSPDGHCRAFDAQAGGMVGGDGVGAVVLKRLEDALAEGDTIYAVIKGTAVNNDGADKIGYTAPSIEGQAAVILEAQAVADVHPDTITMIEAHGTGTPLGDPIEVAALTAAFRTRTVATGYCALGTVKTNIGHTNAAAGVAGIIKTALSLHHKTIPPSLNFITSNPEINFEQSPFYVNTSPTAWTAEHSPRRAGVSSFGLGGTNAHAILEEAPLQSPSGPSRPYQLLTLSAKTETALARQTAGLSTFLQNNPNINLADVAHTLQIGRQRLGCQRAVVVQSPAEAVEKLKDASAASGWTTATDTTDLPLAFMFPGGGAQYVDMGRDLYETEPLFRTIIDDCARLLRDDLEQDFRDYIYPLSEQKEKAASALKRPSIGLPALFAVSYATAQLWISWGIKPQTLIGHSLGEYGAACLAGVLSLEDALRLVVKRGQLFEKMPEGAMLSVGLSESAVLTYFDQVSTQYLLSIAAVNAPEQSVIAGTVDDLAQLERLLEAEAVPFQRLAIDVAAHSVLVDSILDEFRSFVGMIRLSPPQIPFVSNVSGDWITAEQATSPDYWARHLRETVRFKKGIENLLDNANMAVLEVGPGQVLTSLARMNPAANGQIVLNSLRHPKQHQSDAAYLLETLGRLWQAGATIDWSAYYANERRHRLSLPGYPFEKQRYWLDPVKPSVLPTQAAVPKKNPDLTEWLYAPSWQRTGPLQRGPFQWPDTPFTWLIFSDEHGLSSQLANQLNLAGQTVLLVKSGNKYEELNGHFVINPKRPQDYKTLINTLKTNGVLPDHILHLRQWRPVSDFGTVDLEDELDYGFFSLLFLTQALDAHNVTSPIRLAVITSGAHEVTGLEPLAPHRAAVFGPIKVIPFEYENISCLSIDAEFPARTGTAEQLLAECLTPSSKYTENVLAYRGHYRWQQTFTRVAASSTTERPYRLKDKGVYLITGGLGGIGLSLAGYLARTVQARLVLVSRSGLPPRETWQTIEDPLQREQVDAILEMESIGAEVMVAVADVADKGQMTAVFEQIKNRFGSLTGVIHSAGIGGDGAIALKEPEKAAAVLSSKIQGTQVLHKLCPDDLEFFILSSSATSILGGYGQVDYCAANAVLDAYAAYYTRRGAFSVSINWDMWQGVGMGIRTRADLPPDLKKERDESLRLGMATNEGQQVFQYILNANLPQVVVSTYDFITRYKRQNQKIDVSERALETGPAAPIAIPSGASRPNLNTGYKAPSNEVEQIVAARWQLLFGIEQIGVQDDFFALGGHSLLATQLLNRLRKDFPTVLLSLHDLFAKPTIAGIAAIIRQQTDQPAPSSNIGQPAIINTNDSQPEQFALMTAYLQEHLTDVLETSTIDPDIDLLPLGLAGKSADIIWRLRRDMALRVYPQELMANPTLSSMANYLAQALIQQQTWNKPDENSSENGKSQKPSELILPETPTFTKPALKNRPLVFLLSAPRSGSTLLRLMLAGHPALFCPPELSLLAYDSLSDWQAHQQAFFIQTGLHEALSTLLGLDSTVVEARLDSLSQSEQPIQDAYKLLQETAEPQILVDKTPGYALNPAVLKRAESMFNQPKYIHLVRHPYPVIESFVRHRLHVVLGQPKADPAVLAESVWAQSQQNLLNFGQDLPPDRYYQVLYEELVRQPHTVMEDLCRFLDIPFDERVLQPYSGEAMIGGVGDPDILQHDGIDPELGHIWQKIHLPWPLGAETQTLAAAFGYELTNERHTIGAKISESAHLPDNLEELTDDEVERLLQKLIKD